MAIMSLSSCARTPRWMIHQAHSLFQGLLQLIHRDRDRLQEAENIGEPQPNKPDVLLFGSLQCVSRSLSCKATLPVRGGARRHRAPPLPRSVNSLYRRIAKQPRYGSVTAR